MVNDNEFCVNKVYNLYLIVIITTGTLIGLKIDARNILIRHEKDNPRNIFFSLTQNCYLFDLQSKQLAVFLS